MTPIRHMDGTEGKTRRAFAFDIAACRRASPALAAAMLLAACAAREPAVSAGAPVLAAAEKASVVRSLAAVEPGKTAPWTEVATDAVGTARIIGDADGGCLPVEVMRLRGDTFDSVHFALCDPAESYALAYR